MSIDPRAFTTGDLIRYAMDQFQVEREERYVAALSGRAMRTHGPAEKILWLDDARYVKVSVDDSGVATQIEEDEHLHAIVRPHPIRASLGVVQPTASASHWARPRPIKTSFIPRRSA